MEVQELAAGLAYQFSSPHFWVGMAVGYFIMDVLTHLQIWGKRK